MKKVCNSRVVLTLAVGKTIYFLMAVNLARSFIVWHRERKIDFVIATDLEVTLPQDLEWVKLIKLIPGQYGEGFSPKLSLDRISPAEETLFIDADCLCAANLEEVFEKFKACELSVIGSEDSEGELFGDIPSRCRAVGVSWVPRFCGGMYYFKRGETSERIFQTARELEQRYDELGLVLLRGVPNEEPLIGLAMAIIGQRPIPEDGTIKAEPMFFTGQTELDVFAGRARLFNLPGKPLPYPQWRIPDESRPAVVHFNASFAELPPYTSESLRLEKYFQEGWPLPLATFYVWVKCTLPYRISESLKNVLRPLVRMIWGNRAVKASARTH
jgi:hypothetical protein